MTYVIDGGKNITDIKEMVLSVIQGDPILYNSEENMYDFTRPQARARAMEKVKKVLEYWSTEGGKDRAKEVPRSGKKSQDPKKDFADAFWWALSLYGTTKTAISVLTIHRPLMGNSYWSSLRTFHQRDSGTRNSRTTIKIPRRRF